MLPPSGWFCYSVCDGRLFGSEHPENLHRDAVDKRAITRRISQYMVEHQRVKVVINLTPDPCEYHVPALETLHIPLDDNSIAKVDLAVLSDITNVVNDQIERAGAGVWVHCNRGIDRTGLVVGSCLIRRGLDADEAATLVKSHWPEARRRRAFAHDLWEPASRRMREFQDFLSAAKPSARRVDSE